MLNKDNMAIQHFHYFLSIEDWFETLDNERLHIAYAYTTKARV